MSPSVTKSRAAALLAKNHLSEPAIGSGNLSMNRKTMALLEQTVAIVEEVDEEGRPTITPTQNQLETILERSA